MSRARPELIPIGQVESSLTDTASADRPNPIGLHEVQIASIDGRRVLVRDLEALDGTSIVDIKPLLRRM